MSDVIARQAVAHFRLLRGRGLALAQVRHELIGNSALTGTVLTEMIELDSALSAKDHAKAQLALLASIALLPPLFLLELGAALFSSDPVSISAARTAEAYISSQSWKHRWCED